MFRKGHHDTLSVWIDVCCTVQIDLINLTKASRQRESTELNNEGGEQKKGSIGIYEKMPMDQPSHHKTIPICATMTENSQMTATHMTRQAAIMQGKRMILTPGF